MKLWQTGAGSRDERVERFTAGEDVTLDAKLVYYDLCGTLAHVVGLERIGLLDPGDVASIRAALQTLWDAGLTIRPQDEDVHTAVENALERELGALGQKVHAGRSRNDQVLVDLRLYAKEGLHAVAHHALQLARALLDFAQAHLFVPMPGVTHTRQAMPSSLGLWAASFVEGLLESLVMVEAAYSLVDRCPLGAAAGYGVPLPLERQHVAELLGFANVQANALNAISSRGKTDHALSSALGTVMLDLSRLATDLIWYSSETLAFFELPEPFCTGSSIMPNKRNPDVLELVRAKAARVGAHASQAFMLSCGRISGYHRDHQELKGPLVDSLETTSYCLELSALLVCDLKVDEATLRAALRPELFAVDRMLDYVQDGLPLRQAYRKVKTHLDRLELPDAERALKARTHLGGPGNVGLDALVQRVGQLEKAWGARSKRCSDALEKLIRRSRVNV